MNEEVSKIDLLKNKCSQTFQKTNPPSISEISDLKGSQIPHLIEDFANRSWREIDDETIFCNFDTMPLLTAKAFHYYFPAFLLFALNNYSESNEVLEFLIYTLTPSEKIEMKFYLERKSFFTKQEREVIIDFLKLISADTEMTDFYEYTSKAIDFWNSP